jgi:3-methyladenine DNA glycosylase AlkD
MPQDIHSFAEEIISELKSLGDPIRAEGETRYFKDTINSLGTGLPALRKLEKHLCKSKEKTWIIDDVMALCDILLVHKIFEVTLFAFSFLDRYSKCIGEKELSRIKAWLEADLCDNWAAVDHLCPHVIGTVIKTHPEFIPIIKDWAYSSNQWTRRASAVSFILLARKGEFLDDVYEIASVLISDKKEDLVQKGNGWMLREAGRTDPDRLEAFLIKHGPNIPRTTLRYAIEKYPEEKRKQLLAITK